MSTQNRKFEDVYSDNELAGDEFWKFQKVRFESYPQARAGRIIKVERKGRDFWKPARSRLPEAKARRYITASATLYHRKRDAISPQARRYITASATLYHRKRDAIPMPDPT